MVSWDMVTVSFIRTRVRLVFMWRGDVGSTAPAVHSGRTRSRSPWHHGSGPWDRERRLGPGSVARAEQLRKSWGGTVLLAQSSADNTRATWHDRTSRQRPLRDHHSIGRRGDPHRFDVDPELAGPKGWHGHVRAALSGGTDHIMRGDGGLLHGIAPMFQRQKLVVIEGMREAGDIPGDKDIIGDNGIDSEGTAPGVTADPKRPGGEPGIAQPFRIAHRPLRHHHHLGVEGAAIREMRPPHPSLRISLQGGDRHLTSQIHPVLAL